MQGKLALTLIMALAISTAQTSQQPRFQTGTRLTLVPVVVRDRDGRPVPDLRQEDFRLLDNGKPQAITSFSVEQGAATGQSPDHFTAYFFDDLSFNDFAAVVRLRNAALQSFSELQPGDRVGILSSSCRLTLDFTDDRTKLEQMVSKFQPAPISICQVAPTLSQPIALLQALVHRMAVLPGIKNIVIISPGFRVQIDKQRMRDDLVAQAVLHKVVIRALHYAGDSRQDLTQTQPESQEDGIAGGPMGPENLRVIADGTGGEVIEATNSAEAAFRQVATPTCIYVLGFVPESKQDSKYHKLKVTLTDRRKLNIRTRQGYFATPTPAVEASNSSAVVDVTKRNDETPERATTREPVMFRSRTNLVLVPVVVRDRNGQAIGNLQKSDFQLSDQGKRQQLTSFSVEKAERAPVSQPGATATATAPGASPATAAPPVIPDHFVAYVFDDVHIRFGDLKGVRDAVWKNLVETMQPMDRVAVVTTSGKVMLDFTDDREKIHQTLLRVQPTPAFRAVCGYGVPANVCPESLSFMHAYKVTTMDAVAIQKAVPLVAPRSPETAALSALNAGEHESELSLDTLRGLAKRMASLGGSRTIILIGHGFLITDSLQDHLAATIERVIRSGVVIHTLNSSGLRSGMEVSSGWDDDTAGPNGESPYTHEAQMAGAMTLEDIAESTGGTAINNSNDYLAGIRRLAAPPEYRYVLGFAPEDLVANGKFHKLSVKLSKGPKGSTIQARRGYYAPKRGEGLTEAAAKAIEDELFTREELRDLPVELHVAPEDQPAGLSVSVDIDLKLLHYRQADGRNSDDVTAVAAVFDHNGNFIEGKQLLLKLRLRDQTLANLEKQPPETLQTKFDLSPGAYLVRLVVHSAEGQTMAAASRTIDIP